MEAVSDDASKVFAGATSGKQTSLVVITGHERRTIMTLNAPEQFYGASFDGRWLTFGVGHHPGNQHLWTVHAWDSESADEPFQVGDNRAAVRSPWLFTRAHRGKVTWVQGTGKPDQSNGIHLYDLATRTDRVVVEGRVDGPVFFGDLLLWREYDEAKTARFTGVSASDGTPAALPPALRDSRPDWYATADEKTLAWTDGDQKAIHAWRADWPGVRELAKIEPGVELPGISFPQLSGDLIAWTSKLSSVTDIRTGSTYRADGMSTALSISGGGLVVTGGGVTPSVVPITDLPPLPAC
ncbi:hypothetical protein LZG04_02685 [Saccharothrix sp. S26]|uniref:hypothetical protein n=1 Tax=Saccharothrix sp. S26 TaxID=2907215 RepID=UPI001F38E3B4|nr:hypothetical protein [Saccharothrix sp. S26]MCE6993718.1 hypothetical protein [Saccharothrix sp. S26]